MPEQDPANDPEWDPDTTPEEPVIPEPSVDPDPEATPRPEIETQPISDPNIIEELGEQPILDPDGEEAPQNDPREADLPQLPDAVIEVIPMSDGGKSKINGKPVPKKA